MKQDENKDTPTQRQVKAWYVTYSVPSGTLTVDQFEAIVPSSVKNELHEIRDLFFLPENINDPNLYVDGVVFPSSVFHYSQFRIPVWRNCVRVMFDNTSGFVQWGAWGFEYSCKKSTGD